MIAFCVCLYYPRHPPPKGFRSTVQWRPPDRLPGRQSVPHHSPPAVRRERCGVLLVGRRLPAQFCQLGRSSGPVCSCDPNLHLKTIRKKNSRILQLGFAYRFQNQAGGRPWVNPKPNKFTTPFLRSFCTPAFHPMAEIRAIASREQCLTQSTGGSPSVRRRPLEQPTGFRAVLFSFRHSVSVLKVFANRAEYSFHPPPLCCRNPVDAWQGPSGP